MKKIDLHIHTIATISDSPFEFDIDKLKEYIIYANLDAIGITNHNIFDLTQYKEILQEVSIPVFPGIEIDLECSHILAFPKKNKINDLDDFTLKCERIKECIEQSENNSITVEQLKGVFEDLNEYLLIPHYKKNPEISDDTLCKISEYITVGEVSSPKKFTSCKKNSNSLVPVIFSDSRISSELKEFPVKQTFVNCGEVTFQALKNCFNDKTKVQLSNNENDSLLSVFENGQLISIGLNVVVGERSSGKSYTLNNIYRTCENVRYIEQFSLLEKNEKDDEKKFNELLSRGNSLVTKDFLDEFQIVTNDIISVNLSKSNLLVEKYLETLMANAKESDNHDSFAKVKIFSEENYKIQNLKELDKLIASTIHLIENIEYKRIIESHVNLNNLRSLVIELMDVYKDKYFENKKRSWINELLDYTKGKLEINSSSTRITEVDLYNVALDEIKIKRFNVIAKNIQKEVEIERKSIQGFEIVAKSKAFENASDVKKVASCNVAFSEAYKKYQEPYEYLLELKKIPSLSVSELYKFFAKIEYRILNKDGFEVSGGERSEFNLLQNLKDAHSYDMLLIDEPESSFDNLFLKNEVNQMIKEISKTMPVVLVTHNNTVGASIKPDYLLCTKKEIINGKVEYRVYSGYPTDKRLNSPDGKSIDNYKVTMECLEAGKIAYNERRKNYEIIEN